MGKVEFFCDGCFDFLEGAIAIPDAVRDGPVGFVKVVDSWAMVAWLSGEPSAPLVGQFILDAEAGSLQWLMSLINAAETLNNSGEAR